MKGSARILLTIAGVVILAAAVAVLVIVPMHSRMGEDLASIDERGAQLVKLEKVARRISDLQQGIQRLESALAFFENRLPKEREIDVILREVWQIAESKSLVTRSIRTTTPEALARYNCQPITLTLDGPFEGFYEFLLGLEQMPRLTKIRQMRLAKSATNEGQVQVTLVMDIFFEKSQ